MIELELHAHLDISAASGLVVVDDTLCVIADDENFLATYAIDGTPRARLALFEGVLPEAHAERKRAKPDLEALVLLPSGQLLALGSGSTPARRRGALVDGLRTRVQTIDISALYEALMPSFPELNIEGAAVLGSRLWLAQRGNGQLGNHALVELDLQRVLDSIERHARIDAGALCGVHGLRLGDIDGVPLSITDLAAHPSGADLLFTATAEASPDTYQDGVCVGSAIGRVGTRGEVGECERTDGVCKLEGIAVGERTSAGNSLWLVADPDDRVQRAPLYRAQVS